jgi:hypothetical protein
LPLVLNEIEKLIEAEPLDQLSNVHEGRAKAQRFLHSSANGPAKLVSSIWHFSHLKILLIFQRFDNH